MSTRVALITCVVGLLAVPTWAASPETAAKVAEGNAALAAGDFDAALKAYDNAEVTCPECPELAYDRGLVHYRMRDFAKARDQFNAALATRDLGLEARAKYNLGVVSYSEALEKLNAPKEAIELARQAIYHYRDALELNPEDADARANIETAQLLIKDLIDKLKNEQEQQKQDQQNQQQQNQEQDQQEQQQDQQQQDQQQQDQDQQQQQEQQQQDQQSGENQEQSRDEQSSEDQKQSEEQQQQEQDQQQSGEQAQQDESQQQSGEQNAQSEPQESEAKAGEQRKMTKEELDRALQAVRDREAQRREDRARRRNVRRAPVTRDW